MQETSTAPGDPPDLVHLRDGERVLAALRPSVRAHVSVRARRGVVEARGLRKVGRPDLRIRPSGERGHPALEAEWPDPPLARVRSA